MTTPRLTQDTAMPALLTWLRAVSGLAGDLVRASYQTAPTGATAYIVVTPQSDVARSATARVGTAIEQSRRLTVQIDGYGWPAVEGVRRAAVLAQSDDAASRTMYAAGLSVTRVGNVRNTTALQTSTYEPRATLDLVVGYVTTTASTAPEAATQVRVDIEGRDAPTIDIDVDSAIDIDLTP